VPDKNDEMELTDDQLRELIATVEEGPFLTPEEQGAVLARLQPEMDAALARRASFRPTHRPFFVGDQDEERKKRSS
jgi:hypothetical protein